MGENHYAGEFTMKLIFCTFYGGHKNLFSQDRYDSYGRWNHPVPDRPGDG